MSQGLLRRSPLFKCSPVGRTREFMFAQGRQALALDGFALRRWDKRRRVTPGLLIVEPDDERALEMEEAFEKRDFHAQSVSSMEQAELAAWGNRFEAVIISCGPDASTLPPFLAWLRREYGEVRGPLVVALLDALNDAAPFPAEVSVDVQVINRSSEMGALVDAVNRSLASRQRFR